VHPSKAQAGSRSPVLRNWRKLPKITFTKEHESAFKGPWINIIGRLMMEAQGVIFRSLPIPSSLSKQTVVAFRKAENLEMKKLHFKEGQWDQQPGV
jgi:hypothetical protein